MWGGGGALLIVAGGLLPVDVTDAPALSAGAGRWDHR